MYFKRLEIFGFKSFADKTVLNFEPGITAIIGPNGCGKSNVFDAIRWSLGEQSSKELRGSAMEDVIFNGTDKKSGLGFAEVSITLSNESKMLPIEYDEVTVTRRLFRSGESEYLINKTPMRLKDITELFMGTGIGAEAYSLVQQGKVDLVVSARPEDRRVLLDEASGITKYKSKRKEAMNKLADTDNNLLRINDIIVEVKRQISSLERQANKARRYKDEFEKLKNLEVKLANYEIDLCGVERGDFQGCLRSLHDKENELSSRLKEFNESIQTENNRLTDVEEQINDINAEDIKLDGQIDINNRQIGFNEERIENIILNESRLKEKQAQLKERCQVQHNKIEELRQTLAGLNDLMQQKLSLLNEKKALLISINDTIRDAEQSIRKEEESVLDISSSQVQVKNRLTEIMKEVQGALARKRRLEVERNKVSNEKMEVDEKLKTVSQKLEASQTRIDQMRGQRESQQEIQVSLTQELSSLQQTIDDLEKKKLFLKSQKDFIEKLSVQYEGMPDPGVEGRFFTDTPPQEFHSGIIGKVKQVSPINGADYGKLSSCFANSFKQLYEIICETKFIELDPQQISQQIDLLSAELGEKIVQKEDITLRLDQQKKIIGQLELDIQEEEKILSVYSAQKNDIVQECQKLVDELDLVQMEWDEVSGNLESLKQREDDLSGQLDVLSERLNVGQMNIRDNQKKIAVKTDEREDVTVAIAQLETEIASEDDKRLSLNENLNMFQEELDASLEEIHHIETEFTDFENKKIQFRTDIDDIKKKIVQLKEDKQSLQQKIIQLEKQKDELIVKINDMRSHVSVFVNDLEDVRKQIHQQEMHIQEVSFKVKEIKDRLMQTYKIDLEAFNAELKAHEVEGEAAAAPADQPPESFDAEATRVAIERLRKRCDSFGSVNMVAIDEYDELRDRFEFLTKQQSDLITAKESLHNTIRKINRQTRQMFMDTFTKVSEEFRIYFRMLFGGGEARLVLLDPENVLESGIEIVARPPGKKLQNISLLSGGEKTLTAIALIFGVFKVNPSPFCVLDEIDAALDESNIGRFSYLLKDFSKISQFIVITHSKKTIASSDAMYGITMEETGVSKVVSVKFKEDMEQKESTPQQEAVAASA